MEFHRVSLTMQPNIRDKDKRRSLSVIYRYDFHSESMSPKGWGQSETFQELS
jgi:hypothetical protein